MNPPSHLLNTDTLFKDLLGGSKFADEIPLITEVFDKTTKSRFVDSDQALYVKFGGLRDRAPELNIKSGQLKLLG